MTLYITITKAICRTIGPTTTSNLLHAIQGAISTFTFLSPFLSSFLISTFLQTLYSFHCADTAGPIPRGEEGHDLLYKHTQTVTKNFKTHYKAACELTIDDSMIGTKCILHYLLKKPTNGEVQVCVHADAATAYIAQHSPSTSESTNSYNSRSVAAVRLNQSFDL